MSWHYSRALGAAYSEASSLGGQLSAPSKLRSMRVASLWPDRTTEVYLRSQYGMTCELSTEGPGVDWWISSLEASRARTSASPVREKGSPGSARGYGRNSHESLARWDRDSCSWRTHQLSLEGDWEPFSEIWPRWGMMRNGECWALTMPAHLISGTGSGLWQTPVADDAVNRTNGKVNSRGEPKLSAQVKWQTPTVQDSNGRDRHTQRDGTTRPSLLGQVRNLPTPCALEVEKDLEKWASKRNAPRSTKGGSHGPNLATAVKLWPTPLATDGSNGGPNQRGGKGDLRLSSAVALWPTPIHSEARQGYQNRSNGKKGTQKSLTTVAVETGGHATPGMTLNPAWVEWLMGWPIGWTALEPLEMGRFRQWLDSHGRPYGHE